MAPYHSNQHHASPFSDCGLSRKINVTRQPKNNALAYRCRIKIIDIETISLDLEIPITEDEVMTHERECIYVHMHSLTVYSHRPIEIYTFVSGTETKKSV